MLRRRSLPLRLVEVQGPSMAPALRHGDVVLVSWGRRQCHIAAGAVVVVQLPGRPLGVKRVVRLVPAADGEQLWVQGDNDLATTDSREFGALPHSAVRGRVIARVWPRPGRIPTKPVESAGPDPK